MAATPSQKADEAILERIRRRLMETGDWDRFVARALYILLLFIQSFTLSLPSKVSHEFTYPGVADEIRISRLLRAQLDESGWEDDLKDLAKGELRLGCCSLPSGNGYSAACFSGAWIAGRSSADLSLAERARAQERPSLQGLLGEITPKAQSESSMVITELHVELMRCGEAMIQPSIRSAVIQEIEAVLEREVEKA